MAYKKQFVIEKRKADGSLDFSVPQPPFFIGSEDDICQHYFKNTSAEIHGGAASMGTIYLWYKEQGFEIRPKTW